MNVSDNKNKFLNNSPTFSWLIAAVVYAMVAVPVLSLWIFNPGFDGFKDARYIDMVYGKAHKPYVTRALAPFIIRGVTRIVRPLINEKVLVTKIKFFMASPEMKYTKQVNRVFLTWRWTQGFLAEYIAGLIIMYLCLIVLGLMIRKLVLTLYDTLPVTATAFGFFSLMCLPMMFRYYSYIYDFFVPIFFVGIMILIHKRRMTWFYPVYFLMVLNKETAMLVPIVFWLQTRHDAAFKKMRWVHICSMFAVYFIVRLAIGVVFSKNPGLDLQYHLFDHNYWYLLTLKYHMYEFVAFGVFLTAIFYKWEEKPKILGNTLFLFLPLFGLTLLFGFLDEMRDYYEVYPAAMVLVGHTICRVLNVKLEPKPLPEY